MDPIVQLSDRQGIVWVHQDVITIGPYRLDVMLLYHLRQIHVSGCRALLPTK